MLESKIDIVQNPPSVLIDIADPNCLNRSGQMWNFTKRALSKDRWPGIRRIELSNHDIELGPRFSKVSIVVEQIDPRLGQIPVSRQRGHEGTERKVPPNDQPTADQIEKEGREVAEERRTELKERSAGGCFQSVDRDPPEPPSDLLEHVRRAILGVHFLYAVHDLGMGFMMIGGSDSFGAGGYNDSPIERISFVYPDSDLGWLPGSGILGVMLVFLVASMAFGVAILKPLGIQI